MSHDPVAPSAHPLHAHLERDGFCLRGLHMSRIDGFSDVVFGFALTLLVVSLEIPKTYAELHASLRGFLPFAISFLFLMMVWFSHYKFFRRFGTHDFLTIVINAALLFVVLFYVYPLKFLFTFLTSALTSSQQHYFETYQQIRELMLIYGFGFAAVYFLIAALNWNGLRQREHLQLNALEVVLARSYIVEAAGVGAVGLLSCLAALVLPIRLCGLSGWVYMLIGAFKTYHGYRTRKQTFALKQQAIAELVSHPHTRAID